MSADTAAVLIVLFGAPAATLFPIVYGLTAKWWRSLVGVALMTTSTGLAMLMDISLIYQWLGDDYALRDVVRLFVYSWIAVGAWLKLSAYLYVKYAGRADVRDRFMEQPPSDD